MNNNKSNTKANSKIKSKNKIRIKSRSRRTFAIVLAVMLCVAIVPAYMAFADDDFLSEGSPQVKSGEGYSFRINLDAFREEYEEASKAYTLSVQVSPNPASFSVSPDVNVQQFGSKLTFSSADLGAVNTLTVTVYPGSNIIQEQTYNISVNVAGELSTPSGELSFTAVTGQGGQDIQGNTDMKNGGKKMSGGKSGSVSAGSSGTTDSSLVYAGSWDNYLEALAVEGYEFTNKFNKTRDTYFIDVPDDVDSVSVSATPSDSSAAVRISGEDNISEDLSKIMINVTADNGEVRTYRIYVRH